MDDFDDDLFDDEFPPFQVQVWNFIKSMAKVFWALITLKKVKVSDREFMRRHNICMDCDQLLRKKRCKQCGCFVDPKARLLTEKCPLGKWSK